MLHDMFSLFEAVTVAVMLAAEVLLQTMYTGCLQS